MNFKFKTEDQPANKASGLHQTVKKLQARETISRQADEALKVSGTRYRRLFETAQDWILLLDKEGDNEWPKQKAACIYPA